MLRLTKKISKGEVTFFSPNGPVLTGQELASKLILQVLDGEYYHFKTVKLPGFDRNRRWSIIYIFCFLAQIANVWWRFFTLIFKRRPIAYLNLGQSLKALVCDGLPFYLCSFLKSNMKCVISLHGWFFLNWQVNDLRLRLFTMILKRAGLITVLGVPQKDKLVALGIDASRIHIVNNTCEFKAQTIQTSSAKKDCINLLYLSNLIEAKGYKTYLGALLKISRISDFPIRLHAVLCGRLAKSSLDSNKTNTVVDNDKWIRQTIETINKSSFIKITWVEGAYGNDKESLFNNADIFVYPSNIDAQPIVLIEAMATGCAVICSGVGAIPAMVGKSAMILRQVNINETAEAIIDLVIADDRRTDLARAARKHFEQYFSQQAYATRWESIFAELTKNDRAFDRNKSY